MMCLLAKISEVARTWELIRASSIRKNVWSPLAPIHVAFRPYLAPILGMGDGLAFQQGMSRIGRPSCPFWKSKESVKFQKQSAKEICSTCKNNRDRLKQRLHLLHLKDYFCITVELQQILFSHREAAKCEDLPIHEENSCVVTACCHLHTRTRKSLHQSWRAPKQGKN